jgi:hypothetical protein
LQFREPWRDEQNDLYQTSAKSEPIEIREQIAAICADGNFSIVSTGVICKIQFMMQETSVYSDSNIMITSQKIQVSNNTYFIRNISSVGVAQINPDNNALIVFTVIMGLASFLSLYFKAYLIGVICILFTALLIWLIIRTKPTYVLQLVTNAGQLNTIFSKDYQYIASLKGWVESAICNRI